MSHVSCLIHFMTTALFRIIKYGFQNFSRNGLVSITTTAVLALALLVFQGLIIFNVITNTAVASLQDKIDIAAYFKEEAPEDEILKVERALESLTEVKSVEYISKEKALEIFKERHQNDVTISAALGELETNPLLASLSVKAQSPDQYASIAKYLNSSANAILDRVTYDQNYLAIDRLSSIVNSLKQMGWGTAIFLAVVAALVVFNTVRLAIYSNRDELLVMRLVGASNRFINGPYVVTGLIYGVLAAFVTMILSAPLVAVAAPYVDVFIPELKLQAYFYSHLPQLVFYQMLLGAALGSVSAWVAIRKYLKL